MSTNRFKRETLYIEEKDCSITIFFIYKCEICYVLNEGITDGD